MSKAKSEIELACDLIALLDGLPIEQAENALLRARSLLTTTQTVSSKSPLLLATLENDRAFKVSETH
jgi:hypothetical protein